MKKRHGILVIIILLVFSRGYSSYYRADSVICDTGQLTIFIDCVPTIEGTPLHDDDQIIALYESDTIQETDTLTYSSTFENIIALPAMNLELSDGSIDNLTFSIYSALGSCQTSIVNYHTDDSLSSYCYVSIDYMEASLYSITYPDDIFCLGTDSVFPVTDVPDNAIQYNSGDSLLRLTDQGVISPADCRPGNYTIYFNSDYCLAENSFNFSILDWYVIDLPDSINICSGDQLDNPEILSGYTIYIPGNNDVFDYSDITTDGFYVVTDDDMECPLPDTVYIEIDESPIIDFSLQEECDRVIVSLNNTERGVENLGWTNGSRTDQVEIFDDQFIGVTLMNESGCIASDSVYVDVRILELPDVQYEKEDADCWFEGNVNIESAEVYNNVGSVKYRLYNTITGTIYDNLNNVPEGLYDLEVVDDRDCVAVYDEPITIIQRCLEDYPVFTPNGDSVEDTYFIPYKGTVKIYDLNGALLTELNTPAYWDGTDESGNALPMGTYAIVTDSGKIVNITIIK